MGTGRGEVSSLCWFVVCFYSPLIPLTLHSSPDHICSCNGSQLEHILSYQWHHPCDLGPSEGRRPLHTGHHQRGIQHPPQTQHH